MTGQGSRRHTRRPGVFSPWDSAWAEMPKGDRPLAGLREARRWFEDCLKTGGCGRDGHCQCSGEFPSLLSSRWGA
jgi:hypothetical protein